MNILDIWRVVFLKEVDDHLGNDIVILAKKLGEGNLDPTLDDILIDFPHIDLLLEFRWEFHGLEELFVDSGSHASLTSETRFRERLVVWTEWAGIDRRLARYLGFACSSALGCAGILTDDTTVLKPSRPVVKQKFGWEERGRADAPR